MERDFTIRGFKELGTGNRDYGRGIVRLSGKVSRSIALGRHGLVKLENPSNGQRKYALFRPHDDAEDVLALEYDDRLLLGLNKGHKVRLLVSRASSFYYIIYFLTHPDVNVRLNFLFSVVFCALSAVIGFLLGLII